MQMITAWERDRNLRNGVVLNQLQYDVSQLVDPQPHFANRSAAEVNAETLL
jgi:hypothetical protein